MNPKEFDEKNTTRSCQAPRTYIKYYMHQGQEVDNSTCMNLQSSPLAPVGFHTC